MVFISSILAMLLFATMGLSMATTVSTNLSATNEDMTSSQAFSVAEGGMHYILQNQLVGDTDFSDNVSPTRAPFGGNPIDLSPGQFWVEYSNQTVTSIDVRVTGRVGNAVRAVRQTVRQGGGIDSAVMADGNLNLISSGGTINGDVALSGVANIDPDVTVNGRIVEDPDLQVPAVDPAPYEAMCTSSFVGTYTISENTTADLCVYGNVNIRAGVTYTGLLYATGNVDLLGNNITINGSLVTLGNVNADDRTGLRFTAGANMPAIVCEKNVNLENADGLRITGLLWNEVNTNLDGADNAVLRGSFLSGGNYNMSDAANLSITFDASLTAGIPGLSHPGQTAGGLELSGWEAY